MAFQLRNHRFLKTVFLLLVFNPLPKANAIVQAGNVSITSMEGLFGRPMSTGRIYRARLQFLRENPYLCEDYNPNATTFVQPAGPQLPTRTGNFSFADPIALLVARGECPYQRKAKVAEQMGVNVEFIIVYNFNANGKDLLTPLYSEFGSTRLMLLSISHHGGRQLKEYIVARNETSAGGPVLFLDSAPPDGLLTMEDVQNMLLSALGLFFMLISASSVLMICAGTNGYVITADGRLILVRRTENAPATVVMGNGLLTEEQVRHLSASSTVDAGDAATIPATASATLSTDDSDDDDEVFCAVCLDEIPSDGDRIVLPCKHTFHTDCIIPWLTERQSKCPLCKFDVLAHYNDVEAAQHAPSSEQLQGHHPQSSLRAFSDRILRYRWTRVLGHDEMHARDGVVVAPNEMDMESDVELTEQRLA